MFGWMDRQMDGQTDGWTDRWTVGLIDRAMEPLKESWLSTNNVFNNGF